MRLWIDEKTREVGYVVVFFIFRDWSNLCRACERRRKRLVVIVRGDRIETVMMMMMNQLILFLGVVLQKWHVVPCGVAYGTDVGACMGKGSDAGEVKRVITLYSVNGSSLPSLNAIRTDSTITLLLCFKKIKKIVL